MSWWETVNGLWLGDAPADKVASALGTGRPALPELLAAISAAVERALGTPAPARARLADGTEVTAAGVTAPGDLVTALTTAFREASGDYRNTFDRPPTAHELARTVLFVVAADPAAYLRDPVEPAEITIVPEPDPGNSHGRENGDSGSRGAIHKLR
ncbi:hypothetical protein AB0M02_39375 [Actinoplanes sp. NPDC051861]|uniref:hypothetical protein n=1 Tax=Actinoplanes sp. NPDC051861 TaxID=3155170 RepID=UPI003420E8B3